jgi:hypothetical protein
MPLDTTHLQIMQVEVKADGAVYRVEFPVPKLGDEVQAVAVTGMGDAHKLGGEWTCDTLTREQWEDLR